MALYLLTRHGESTLNVAGLVNGDPSIEAPLTPSGREAAERTAAELAPLAIELCVHTRFQRTRETAEAMLAGRGVPTLVEPLLDDIDVGDLEGASLEEYRAWKGAHRPDEAFPGGESLDDAARRYARAFHGLLERPEETLLVVCHEIAVRYALNAAASSSGLDAPAHAIPNATLYLFDAAALARAAGRIDELVG